MTRKGLGQPRIPAQPPKRPCPPPLVRLFPQGPCVRPGFVTPFGGPASGLWPSGSSAGAPAISGPAITPTPIPVPTCVVAALFAECFTGCVAPTNCGWTIITPAGTVVFDGTKLIEGSSGANPQGEARKPLSSLPSGAFTAQFQFTEIAAPPTANKTYTVGAFDAAGNAFFTIALFGDGTLFIADETDVFIGTWTPVAGATHTVHITVDAGGTLTLYIEGAVIPLTPLVPGPVTGPANLMDTSITNNDLDGQGSFDNIFMADGVLPPSTVFCCP